MKVENGTICLLGNFSLATLALRVYFKKQMERMASYSTKRGVSTPLGVSPREKGINFALFSEHAEKVALVLFVPNDPKPFLEIDLDPATHRTGYIWHVMIENLPAEVEYAYRVDGPYDPNKGLLYDKSDLLIDPYAKSLNSSLVWGESHKTEKTYSPKAKVLLESLFDWQDVKPPNIPKEDLIIYEMHVRAFTQHSSSHAKDPGTFLGIIEKIPYLKSLGVNAIELLPIFEFDECENKNKNPHTKEKLYNFWGYSTVNFFSPMNRYATSSAWDGALQDFKMLVRELHRNQIEVILDVVYNHTAEGNADGPFLSFKGIDNTIYYILTPNGKYLDFTGTGNTFNCNHPVVSRLILDSLRYWISEMHVDGFRFDLVSVLTRGEDGAPLEDPPVIHAINNDPAFSQTTWIAEAWDAAGLYQVGSFPGQGKWAEWNGQYRDIVRRFIKGTDGLAGEFAGSLCGSENLYGHDRSPYHSINFVTAHDGYSLRDLVSYQDKHNMGNGEGNRDGSNQNDSWNCGVEGPIKDPVINALRERQMKNFEFALLVSLGVPMLLMGDEYGHSRKGNNNPYCQDNELNWFLWDELEKEKDLFRFCQRMIQYRLKNRHLLCHKEFLTPNDVEWHGHKPHKPNWSPASRFVAYTLKDAKHPIYIAFNAHFEPATIELPPPPPSKQWYRIVDTAHPSPEDFMDAPQKQAPLKSSYGMASYSSFLAQAF